MADDTSPTCIFPGGATDWRTLFAIQMADPKTRRLFRETLSHDSGVGSSRWLGGGVRYTLEMVTGSPSLMVVEKVN